MKGESKMILKWRNFVQETHGSVLVLMAILMAVLLGFCGLAIDVGHYTLVKNELQKAADAGALAGVRALFPADMKTATYPVIPDCSTAVTVATRAAHWNNTDNAQTVVADIQTGHWDPVARTFGAGCSYNDADFTNAVKVTTHREDTPLFLMQVLGAVPKTIQATSIAAQLPVGGLKPGIGFPITVGRKYHQIGDLKIYMNDDNSDTGSWFTPSPPCSAAKLKGLISNSGSMPALACGDTIYLQNGVDNSVMNLINNLYAGKNITVYIPVVDVVKFNQSTPITGFCGFTIIKCDKDGGKHYVEGIAQAITECPGDVTDNSTGDDYALVGPARLTQ
jgi:Flp pilus assembly protein TadG